MLVLALSAYGSLLLLHTHPSLNKYILGYHLQGRILGPAAQQGATVKNTFGVCSLINE